MKEIVAVPRNLESQNRVTWGQVVRRSLLFGLLAAAASLTWYFLPEKWVPVYALALTVGVGISLFRVDRKLWSRSPAEFWAKNIVAAAGIAMFGGGSLWWLLAGWTDLPGVAGARYLILIGFFATAIGGFLRDRQGNRYEDAQPREKLSASQKAVGFVLFWTAFAGLVFMAEWTTSPNPVVPPPW